MIVDPVLMEVIRNRLDLVVDEMQNTILRVAHSTIIKDAYDATAALFDINGDTLAQSSTVPVHLQMLIPAVARVLERYPASTMGEGDIVIMNDPYEGGTHLPDITLVQPVFVGGEAVALSCTMAHHQDIGGAVPGSTSASAADIFAEGLVIPIMKLYDRGALNSDLLRLIMRNVRLPAALQGDLMAQVACCKMGALRLGEMFNEYGEDVLRLYFDALLEHAERLSRAAIERIPDGSFEFDDYLDGDGVDPHHPLRIKVKVTIDGSDLTADFTGSDPEAAGAINCVPSSTQAGVYFVARALMGPHVPNNAGAYRPIHLVLPEGSIVNSRYPRPVGARTITVHRIAGVVQGAMARAGAEVPAANDGSSNIVYLGGQDSETGRSFVTLLGVPTAGGSGGRSDQDGVDVLHAETDNLQTVPVEAFEQDTPFRVLKSDLWTDSGGPGRWRGGLGSHTVVELLRGEVIATFRRDRHDFQPWGLGGGMPAPSNKTLIRRVDGSVEEIPATGLVQLRGGDRIECYTTGGGGHGDPLDREPWRVRDDVLDRRVSVEAAEASYGVVLRGIDLAVAEESTEVLRSSMRAQRGPIRWVFDRGESYTRLTGRPYRD